jgi:enoyl-CoA hydratase/carnithine racemase
VTFETLLVEVADGVGTVTLNRPDVRNALSAALLGELEAVLAALEADPAARVVVLRGAGERAFCAGADLKGVRERSRRASPSAASRACWRPWPACARP